MKTRPEPTTSQNTLNPTERLSDCSVLTCRWSYPDSFGEHPTKLSLRRILTRQVGDLQRIALITVPLVCPITRKDPAVLRGTDHHDTPYRSDSAARNFRRTFPGSTRRFSTWAGSSGQAPHGWKIREIIHELHIIGSGQCTECSLKYYDAPLIFIVDRWLSKDNVYPVLFRDREMMNII